MFSSVPTKIDRFSIIELLGKGGQGSVYLAKDPNTNHFVALKIMNPIAVDETSRARFIREFTAVSKLKHANIVNVFERGDFENLPYFTMEYIEGVSIGKCVASNREPALICRLMSLVADALAYIHSLGLVHRDLKPGNILIDKNGEVKLTDFGLVKPKSSSTVLTQTFSVMGTLSYIAPEILNNGEIEPRCDLYSFGVVLFELFTGQLPFKSSSIAALITMQVMTNPPELKSLLPECPEQLNKLCKQLMSKDPWDRPTTAESVARTLRQIEVSLTAESSPVVFHALTQGSPLYPKFINRDLELTHLLNTVDPAESHLLPFSITFVQGEGGIGKSRLLREASIRMAIRNVKILRIPVIRADAEPFGALDEFLTEISIQLQKNLEDLEEISILLPELSYLSHHFEVFRTGHSPDTPDGITDILQSKPNLIRYLVRLFARLTRIRPWVVIIEDIHHADASSLSLISELVYWSERENIHCAIWASVREEEIRPDGRFETLQKSLLKKSSCHEIKLNRLSYKDSCKLIASMIHQPHDSLSVTKPAQLGNGHPLLMIETVRGWASDGTLTPKSGGWVLTDTVTETSTIIPPMIKDILSKRLEILSDAEIETLLWAALLDPEIDFTVMKFLDSGTESVILDRLNTLIIQKFLDTSQSDLGESYRFRHVQMKELLLARIGAAEISRRNQDIAEVLSNLNQTDALLPRIARHQELANLLTPAIRSWHAAGMKAYQKENFRLAEDYFKRSEFLINKLAERKLRQLTPLRISNLYWLLQSQLTLGNYESQRHYFERIEPYLEQMKNTNEYYVLTSNKISLLLVSGHRDEALNLLEVLENEVDSKNKIGQYYLLASKGLLNLLSENYIDALKYYKAAYRTMPLANRYSTLLRLAKSYYLIGKYRIAERLLKYALIEYQKRNQVSSQAKVYSIWGNICLMRNDLSQSLNFMNKALKMHRATGNEYWISCNLHDIGVTLCMQNRYSEAIAYLKESRIWCLRKGMVREIIIGAMNYIAALYHLGKLHDAYEEAEIALKTANPTSVQSIYCGVGFSWIKLHILLGQPNQAQDQFIVFTREFHDLIIQNQKIKADWFLTSVYIAMSKGKIEVAEKILNQFAKTNPKQDDSDTQDSIPRVSIAEFDYQTIKIQIAMIKQNTDLVIECLKQLTSLIHTQNEADLKQDLVFYLAVINFLERSSDSDWDRIEAEVPRILKIPFFEYRLWLIRLIHWVASCKGLIKEAEDYQELHFRLKQDNCRDWPVDYRRKYEEHNLFIESIII